MGIPRVDARLCHLVTSLRNKCITPNISFRRRTQQTNSAGAKSGWLGLASSLRSLDRPHSARVETLDLNSRCSVGWIQHAEVARSK